MILGAKGKEQLLHMNHKKKMFDALWFMIKCRVSKKKWGRSLSVLIVLLLALLKQCGEETSARETMFKWELSC